MNDRIKEIRSKIGNFVKYPIYSPDCPYESILADYEYLSELDGKLSELDESGYPKDDFNKKIYELEIDEIEKKVDNVINSK